MKPIDNIKEVHQNYVTQSSYDYNGATKNTKNDFPLSLTIRKTTVAEVLLI